MSVLGLAMLNETAKECAFYLPSLILNELRKKIKEGNKEVFFVRHLDPQNPRSTKKEFYSKKIIDLFDSFYEKK